MIKNRIAMTVFQGRLAIAAFLIPLGIRAIPEILVAPYQVGWDTIAFYVPNTLDRAAGKVGPLQMLGTAPLMYTMARVLVRILRELALAPEQDMARVLSAGRELASKLACWLSDGGIGKPTRGGLTASSGFELRRSSGEHTSSMALVI